MHRPARSAHHSEQHFMEYGTVLAACDESSLYKRSRVADGITVMKISARQVRAVLDAYARHVEETGRGRIDAQSRGSSVAAPDEIRREFEMLPEERDIVVHDLRAKIRAGRYFVSSTEIVDALLGRLAANLIAKQ